MYSSHAISFPYDYHVECVLKFTQNFPPIVQCSGTRSYVVFYFRIFKNQMKESQNATDKRILNYSTSSCCVFKGVYSLCCRFTFFDVFIWIIALNISRTWQTFIFLLRRKLIWIRTFRWYDVVNIRIWTGFYIFEASSHDQSIDPANERIM